MNCRILILFGQNSICLSDQDRRNSQLILTTRRIPTTKDDGFRRQIKQRKQILQRRISCIRVWFSLGRGLTFVTADTDMAVKATMWKLIIIKNILAIINIIFNSNMRHLGKNPLTIPHGFRSRCLGPVREGSLGIDQNHFCGVLFTLHITLLDNISGIAIRINIFCRGNHPIRSASRFQFLAHNQTAGSANMCSSIQIFDGKCTHSCVLSFSYGQPRPYR